MSYLMPPEEAIDLFDSTKPSCSWFPFKAGDFVALDYDPLTKRFENHSNGLCVVLEDVNDSKEMIKVISTERGIITCHKTRLFDYFNPERTDFILNEDVIHIILNTKLIRARNKRNAKKWQH